MSSNDEIKQLERQLKEIDEVIHRSTEKKIEIEKEIRINWEKRQKIQDALMAALRKRVAEKETE
jgi:hypothetical protein